MTVPGASLAGRRPAIRLVVNADDLGISARVNDGIVLAHRSGIVTAASIMAVGRAFDHAVGWCRRVPSLDVGVHLTLVAATPLLAQASSLKGADGRFPASAGAFLRRFLSGRIRLADIRAELSAQIERVLDHGVSVSHLDSHQHVHALPGIAQLALELAARYGIARVRAPIARLRMERSAGLRGVLRLAGAMALRASWGTVRAAGLRDVGRGRLRFLGFAEGGRLDQDRLQRLLLSLRPGHTYELMCHPGLTPQEPDIQRWGYRHERELQALTSAATHALIAARGIRLCGYGDLSRSGF
jgi:predicted glycoside hydrolase/deacetylase ChbG (UPF0249 family)